MPKYQMHNHTKQASACASIDASEYISYLKSEGYDGLFITDHFYHGNTCVNKNQTWSAFVRDYMKGYLKAKEEGDKQNFKVFFGVEEWFDGDEYLLYGIDEEFLLNHPEIKNWTREQMYSLVHQYGGCVIQAHPLRDAYYLNHIYLNIDYTDGIEIINTHNSVSSNILSLAYGKHFGLNSIVGCDVHHKETLDKGLKAWIEYDKALESTYDFASRILKNDFPRIVYQEIDKINVATNSLPVTLINNGISEVNNEELKKWVNDIDYKMI